LIIKCIIANETIEEYEDILAKVSIYMMMDYVEREKIQSPSLTDVEMEEDLKKSKKLFEEMKL